MAEQISESSEWGSAKKSVILFIIAYIFLYLFPFPFDWLTFTENPYIEDILLLYTKATDAITLWVGSHILQIHPLEKIQRTGSGDTTFDYVKMATNIFISIIISIVIFLFTRKHKNYEKPYEYTIIYIRYFLGFCMISYGLAKFNDGQFPSPSLFKLEQSFGNSSPMGLLWAFMGYSKAYSTYTGIFEIIGGCLLLFRRTTVMGSLITLIIMINVAILNFCYDVPVKLFSLHLVLFTLIILAPNLIKLRDFLLLNRPAVLIQPKWEMSKKWMRIGRVILKSIVIIGIVSSMLIDAFERSNENGVDPSFNGVYYIKDCIVNKDSLTTVGKVLWNKMIIENNYAKIITVNDSSVYYQAQVDTLKKTILLSTADSSKNIHFGYQRQMNDYIYLLGLSGTDIISVTLKKKSIEEYPLKNRGFHWVTEYPNNR